SVFYCCCVLSLSRRKESRCETSRVAGDISLRRFRRAARLEGYGKIGGVRWATEFRADLLFARLLIRDGQFSNWLRRIHFRRSPICGFCVCWRLQRLSLRWHRDSNACQPNESPAQNSLSPCFCKAS